jgi:putative transcription factor
MSFQDWTPVTLTKHEKKPKGSLKPHDIVEAQRKGEPVVVQKKCTVFKSCCALFLYIFLFLVMGGTNKSSKAIVPHASKIDEDTGNYHINRVSHDFATALQKARLAKKMTQAELAKAVNEKTSVINDYENKRVSPTKLIAFFF